MNTKWNIGISWLAGAAAILALAGCGSSSSGSSSSHDNKSPAELVLTASSTSNPTALAELGTPGMALTLPDGVVVTEFWIALEDIEFERQGEDMDDETDDPEFEGPFYVNLLDPSGILAQSLGEITIPAGTYEGIEFDMHEDEEGDTPAELLGRSIYLAGTWTDPVGPTDRDFEIWHTTTEEFFITGPNGITVEDAATGNSLVVDFNVDNILAGIDFSLATYDGGSGDFTGDFAISPDSTEPENQALADDIKTNIEVAAEFGEDEDGDGDLEDNEDSEDDGDEDGDGVDDDEEDHDDDDSDEDG